MVKKLGWIVPMAVALCIGSISAAVDDGRMGFVMCDGTGNQTLKGGVTGGAGGPVVTATNIEELVKYCNTDGPLVILIEGTIQITNDAAKGTSHKAGSVTLPYSVFIKSHKSILGKGSNAKIKSGGFVIGKWDPTTGFTDVTTPPADAVHNIIIQNITFDVSGGPSSETDGISIFMHSHHVWVDHCSFVSTPDGALDIKRGASWCTFSYNHFAKINKTALCGHADGRSAQDEGFLKVTYYKNFFDGVGQRCPRVRYGEVHCLNNYLKSCGEGMGAGAGSKIYAENCYITGDACYDKGGKWQDVGCKYKSTEVKPSNVGWEPSIYYKYTAAPVDDVPSIVPANAGVGKIEPKIPDPTSVIPQARISQIKITNDAISATNMFNPIGAKVSSDKVADGSVNASGMYLIKNENRVEVKTELK